MIRICGFLCGGVGGGGGGGGWYICRGNRLRNPSCSTDKYLAFKLETGLAWWFKAPRHCKNHSV